MKITLRVLAMVLSLLLSLIPIVSAETMTVDERLHQAHQYAEARRYDDALFALDLAEASDPGAESVLDARLDVLIAAGRHSDAARFIDEALAVSPTNVALYLKRARVALGIEDVAGARESLQRGMVAAGGDDVFAAQYGVIAEDVIWVVADALAAARDYEGAMRLYRMRPPAEGSKPLFDKTVRNVSNARPPVENHPGIEDEAFDKALAEDRLALKHAEIVFSFDFDQLVEEAARLNSALASYGDEDHLFELPDERPESAVVSQSFDEMFGEVGHLSLSPNGGRFLIIDDGLVMVYDLTTQSAKLIAPAAGIDQAYYDKWLYSLLEQVDDSAVNWSPDGRYVSLSYPRNVLMLMRLGCNLLLIDTEAGTVKPVANDLPADVKPFETSEGYAGAPFRAVFAEDEPVLYYEAFGAEDTDEGRLNAIRAYNCETGETRLIASPDAMAATNDPQMWMTPLGIARTYAHARISDGYGLAFTALDGSETLIKAPNVESDVVDRRVQKLIDLKEGRGLLLSQWQIGEGAVAQGALVVFDMDHLDSGLFEVGVGIQPDMPVQQRFTQYSLADSWDKNSGVFDRIATGELVVPYNAALSPGGRYALIAARDSEVGSALYVHDFDTNITGKLDLTALGEIEPITLACPPTGMNRHHRGLHWLNNNRLLVDIKGSYGIYELAVG